MAETVERRNAPRYPMVLSAELMDLPQGTELLARTAALSRYGCYVDTLNPIPAGTPVQVRTTYEEEVFEALATVVYVSYGLGMGIHFTDIRDSVQAWLDRWLERASHEAGSGM